MRNHYCQSVNWQHTVTFSQLQSWSKFSFQKWVLSICQLSKTACDRYPLALTWSPIWGAVWGQWGKIREWGNTCLNIAYLARLIECMLYAISIDCDNILWIENIGILPRAFIVHNIKCQYCARALLWIIKESENMLLVLSMLQHGKPCFSM